MGPAMSTPEPLHAASQPVLAPDEAALRDELWSALPERLGPLAAAADQSDVTDPQLVAVLRDLGLFRHFLPPSHGGLGLSITKICLIREALAYQSVAADEFFASQGVTVQPILMWGTPAQRDEYLDGLLSGRRTYAFCLTEPGAGSDVRGIATSARQLPAGWELNGTKRFVYQGDAADTLVVVARTAEERSGGLTAFLFDRPASGCVARAFPLLFPAPEFELDFTSCAIPADAVLGAVGSGARVALSNLDRLRPSVGAAAVGMAQRALDESVDYLRRRQAFGQRLGDFQGLQFRLAELATDVATARLLVYAAARWADGATDGSGAIGPVSAAAKLHATEVAQRVVDAAVQFHGGVGLARGSVTERLYKAVRAPRIYEGANEIMKLVIARSVLASRPE